MLTRPLLTLATIAGVLTLALSLNASAQEPAAQMPAQMHAAEHQDVTPTTRASHEAAAERLESEAQQLDQQAAQHQKDAVEYRKRIRIMRKFNYAAMANHCDRLAKSLRASATAARELAQLHRDMAKLTAQ